MALTIGTMVKWTKEQIINVQQNVENRKLDFGKEGYLKGEWNDAFGDMFEVIELDGVNILVDGHHRQHAITKNMLTGLPAEFNVLLRVADSIDDIRARQDALMENRRSPTAGQRKDIAVKRVGLKDLKSKHAKAVGVTAYKLLGFKGSTALVRGAEKYKEALFIFENWEFNYKQSLYPQGILAAILSTINDDDELAKQFWTDIDNKIKNPFVKAVRAVMESSLTGESYNIQCYATANAQFSAWKMMQEAKAEATPAFTPDEAAPAEEPVKKTKELDDEFIVRIKLDSDG